MINHQPQEIKGNALRRINVLSLMICSLIRSGRASLQSIGQDMELGIDLESRVKKAKRWLKSKWTDAETHFIPYLIPIIRSLSKTNRIIIAIDGSSIGDCMTLMISIIWKNRAIPVCWTVRKAPKGHFPEQMHVDLIKTAASIFEPVLGKGHRIILLGDGEFDGVELMKTCREVGWLFVVRTGKDCLISDNPKAEGAIRFDAISPEEGEETFFMTDIRVTRQAYGHINALWWHEKKYEYPIFLLTNIDEAPFAMFCYKKRYCIETFFSDIKSRGFNINRTKIVCPEMIFNLLIVAALAFILAILAAFEGIQSEFLPKFIRKDRVKNLSIFQIGLRTLKFFLNKQHCFSFQFSNNFP